MDIHKGILVKEIDDQDKYIYPKSSSDMISHGEDEETTVENELDRLNNQSNINANKIENVSNEVKNARLPAAGGDIKASINDRLNADYSNLKQQISTLSGQLSGDLNRITSLINTENRNNKLIVSNYKEISRARRAISDNTVKDTINDRINTDYTALFNKINTGYDTLSTRIGSTYTDLYDKEKIINKILRKHVNEIRNSRTSLSDNNYKYCIRERIDVDYTSLNNTLNNVNNELSNARTTTVYVRDNSHTTYNSIGARLEADFTEIISKFRIINDELDAAINANNSEYSSKASLKGRLESDYNELYLLINNISNNVNASDLSTLHAVLPKLYLTSNQLYTVDSVMCIGAVSSKKRISCYIPTPPLINVNSIQTIESNLNSEARIVVRVADNRNWLANDNYNNIFISDHSDGEIANETGGNVYFKNAIETAISANLSATTVSFTPRKYGIEFALVYNPGFAIGVVNQPIEISFVNLKLQLM